MRKAEDSTDGDQHHGGEDGLPGSGERNGRQHDEQGGDQHFQPMAIQPEGDDGTEEFDAAQEEPVLKMGDVLGEERPPVRMLDPVLLQGPSRHDFRMQIEGGHPQEPDRDSSDAEEDECLTDGSPLVLLVHSP